MSAALSDPNVKLEMLLGTVEIIQTSRQENGWLVVGSYSIHRDQNGVEVSRTEPTDHARLGL